MKLLYRVDEARAAIGCGLTKLYELLASGELEAKRLGRRTLITSESLLRYVESLPAHTTPGMRARAASEAETAPEQTARK